jgi:transcription termination factor Rho
MDDDSKPTVGGEGSGSAPAKKKASRPRAASTKSAPPAARKKTTKQDATPELDLGPEVSVKPRSRSRNSPTKTTLAKAAPEKAASAKVAPATDQPKVAPTERKAVVAAPKAQREPAAAQPATEQAPPSVTSPASTPAPVRSQDSESKSAPQPTPSAAADSGSFKPSKASSGEAPAADSSPEPKSAGESSSPQRKPQSDANSDNRGSGQSEGEGDAREPWWKRNKGGKEKRGAKRGKWKKGGDSGREPGRERERPPAQPLPPGMAETRLGDLPDAETLRDLAALDAAAKVSRESTESILQLRDIYPLSIAELGKFGLALGAEIDGVPGRRQWLESIFKVAKEKSLPMRDRGWLDLNDQGYGFIVHDHVAYRLYPENSFIPPSLVKRYGLKRGHEVEVVVRPPEAGERCPAVIGIDTVMGRDPTTIAAITPFEELEPYYPLKRILMEAPVHKDISMRAVDLLTPIGFGQRGLIVAPPRTGKTVLLQNMANSVSHNFPGMKLILLLIDERPEEVTDFKRHTQGEVVSSTFDEAPENHVHAAEMVIEKARRLVELGDHVVILLDSITRLARAYNALSSNSGKIMSGGLEATAMQRPKRFFGSARNIEGGGSLTILGTALVDTNSKMDEVIFEEFKGTGNMELHLDRGLSDKRIFPAINIDRSGTRKEELIYHPAEMERVYGLRRAMQGIPPVEAMEMFITRLRKTKSNAEFLMGLNK